MDSVFRTPQVHILGEIVGARGFSSSRVYARWRVKVGTSWRLYEGKDEGETFYDCSDVTLIQQVHDLAVFEHPLDLHYSCTTITGWPRLYIEVWTVDIHGRHSIAGYGNITFPLAPGDYNLEVLTWRPEGSTYDKAMSFFLGANPELVYKDMVLSGNDRFGMQAMSAGRVELRVGIIVKDFNLHGVIL